MRPVQRVVSPIIDHNIELTELAKDSAGWYRGETMVEPKEFMSLKLNPDMNNAADKLMEFIDTIKGFAPGEFPCHCHAIRELEFTTKHLIRTLSKMIDGTQMVFASALKHLGGLFAAISDPAAEMMLMHDYAKRVARKGRGKHNQDKVAFCLGIWSAAQKDYEFKYGLNTRLTHKAVYSRHHAELEAKGITTAKAIKKANKRIYSLLNF